MTISLKANPDGVSGEIHIGGVKKVDIGATGIPFASLNGVAALNGSLTQPWAASVINCTGDITAYATSDFRLKTDIANISDALNKVSRINGVTFTWNELSGKPLGVKEAGVIAQELQEVLPEVVVTRDDGYMAVRYEKIIPLLIEAIKELKVEIDTLKANK